MSIKTFLDGEFDGDFHKVINLKIGGELNIPEDTWGEIGFFTVASGTIKNLSLIMDTELNISSVNKFSSVGLLVGQLDETSDVKVKKGNIQNCFVEGKIDINISGWGFNLGGVVGSNYGEIENCCNSVDLKISANLQNSCRVGGICGVFENGANIVKNCYNIGNIYIDGKKGMNVGGLMGICNKKDCVSSLYNIGHIIEDSSQTDAPKGSNLDGCYAYPDTNVPIDKVYSLDNLISTDNNSSVKVNNSTLKTNEELSGQKGVELLNDGQEDGPWTYDKDINNGFPILKWQLTNEEDN